MHIVSFTRLLTQIVKLRAHLFGHHIKRMDNTREFSSKRFNKIYEVLGIEIKHPVAHIHTENELVEPIIKMSPNCRPNPIDKV